MKTKNGKININKVEKQADNITEKLNGDEITSLIDRLVEYKEGNISIRTFERIIKNK